MNIERWVLAWISITLLALAVSRPEPSEIECKKAIQYLESKGTRYER